MSSTPRSQKIQSILEARRPMAEKVHQADETLNQIESQIRNFKQFIQQYASRLDPEAASAVSALLPDTDQILAGIEHERGRLRLLAGRYKRLTLNIGVAGRARQGKSWFLQKLTGLTPDEIPSGDQGHCTGAPSVIINHDSEITYADITFHTSRSFLHDVVAPFFDRLGLGTPPASIAEFRSATISLTANPNSKDPTTDEAFLEKLIFFQKNIGDYEKYLTGQTVRASKEEIRGWIAQDDKEGKRKDAEGKPYSKWVAVQMASVYCRFPHQDLGSIAVADTPGIGDFVSGSDDRLVSMIGKNLDSIIFLRMPEPIGALIKPEDTALHSVVTRSIPDIPINAWSYFIINKNLSSKGKNLDQIPRFQELLEGSPIRTKKTLVVNCSDQTDVASSFDLILNDIAGNLHFLDQSLFNLQAETINAVASNISLFAAKAANVLPKANLLQPEENELEEHFSKVWLNFGNKFKDLVGSYKLCRNELDREFLAALSSVFATLDEGPKLPEPSEIDFLSANMKLATWSNEKLLELRVKMASSFESIDTSLHACFEKLRNEVLEILLSDSGGKLASLIVDNKISPWQMLMDRWIGLRKGNEMRHAIELFMTAGLSFRGFIQPRVRHCLDVFDSDCDEAKPFCHSAGDTSAQIKDKIELAWQKASYNCKSQIEDMAKEPAMARFTALEDFREAVINMGGEAQAQAAWRLFYTHYRADIWPKEFSQLAADTALRKEWDEAVSSLSESSKSLFAL